MNGQTRDRSLAVVTTLPPSSREVSDGRARLYDNEDHVGSFSSSLPRENRGSSYHFLAKVPSFEAFSQVFVLQGEGGISRFY